MRGGTFVRVFALCVLCSFLSHGCRGDGEGLPAVIGDNMVLQRDQPCHLGWDRQGRKKSR